MPQRRTRKQLGRTIRDIRLCWARRVLRNPHVTCKPRNACQGGELHVKCRTSAIELLLTRLLATLGILNNRV
jgi:hypothetical protein